MTAPRARSLRAPGAFPVRVVADTSLSPRPETQATGISSGRRGLPVRPSARRCVAGQRIGDVEPREPFFVIDVELGTQRLRLVEGAHVEVDLTGEALPLVGERECRSAHRSHAARPARTRTAPALPP